MKGRTNNASATPTRIQSQSLPLGISSHPYSYATETVLDSNEQNERSRYQNANSSLGSHIGPRVLHEHVANNGNVIG